MAEETKVATELEKKEATEKLVTLLKETNYVSGSTWICKSCGFTNKISNWRCVACFSTLKKSMQKEKALRQREARKSQEKYKQRQARREAVRAAKAAGKKDTAGVGAGAGASESAGASEQKEEADDVEAGAETTDAEPSPLKYKLSPNIPNVMRALIKEKGVKGYKYVTDYPVPTPKEDELLIRSFSVAIGASDSTLYNWSKDASSGAKTPFIPGHEAAGLIVGVGKNCRFRIGERVSIENYSLCDIDAEEIWSDAKQFGHGNGSVYGGCCEYYTVPQRFCYLLKSDISWRSAALLEPLGIAYNACIQTDLNERPGGNKSKTGAASNQEALVVIGCDSIGCMTIGVAKSMPLTGQIIAIDTDNKQLSVASKMGADVVINPRDLKGSSLSAEVMKLTDGVGAGRIIECSGNSAMIGEMFGLCRKGACITMVGLPKESITIANPMQNLLFKTIQLRTIYGRRTFRTWNRSERLIADGKINLDPIVSGGMVPLSKFEDAYKIVGSGETMKIVFDVTLE